jgi:uncharacterized membrane protein (UPF0127 family)
MKFRIVFLLTCILLLSACNQKQAIDLCLKSQKGSPDAICIKVEMADTPAAREKGLSDRDLMERENGMLFIFQEKGGYGFWMKDMRFPLDIMWLGEDKTVVLIKENLQPCKPAECPLHGLNVTSLYVLETNANFARKNNITEGTKVYFEV